MHVITLLAFQEELEKLGGVMEDAHAEYMGSMKKHMHNPQVVSRMHPTERQAVFKHLNSPKNAGLGGKIVAKAGKAVATMSKAASNAAELAGLGILAAPSVAHMAGKEWSEKNKARAEVGGLGVLAAPSALAVGKKAVSKGKAVLRAANVNKIRNAAMGVAKHAGIKDVAKRIYHSDKALHRTQGFAAGTLAAVGAKKIADHRAKKKEAAPSMGAMMNMHRLADAAKAAKGGIKPAAQAAVKLPNQAAQAARASSLAGHTAQGGHAWNPAAQAKRAIPL